jgi:hypothetical protein
MAEPNLQKGSADPAVRDLQAFLVVPMSGYSAFRIAEDVPVGNESPGLIGTSGQEDPSVKTPGPK